MSKINFKKQIINIFTFIAGTLFTLAYLSWTLSLFELIRYLNPVLWIMYLSK